MRYSIRFVMTSECMDRLWYGPVTRYVKLWVTHAPGTFSPPPRVSDPDMHHGTCVTHVPWCMPGSLTSGFLWSRWRGKRSQHSRRMRNPQFYVSGKRLMEGCWVWAGGEVLWLRWMTWYLGIRTMDLFTFLEGDKNTPTIQQRRNVSLTPSL